MLQTFDRLIDEKKLSVQLGFFFFANIDYVVSGLERYGSIMSNSVH